MGQMTPFDLVVLLLVSEAVGNAMLGGDLSVTGGLIAAGVLIGGNHLVATARDRIPWLQTTLEGSPTTIVSNGRFQRKAMHEEGIDEEDIMTAMRAHGIANVKDVRQAVLETDGSIGVVAMDDTPQSKPKPKRKKLTRR